MVHLLSRFCFAAELNLDFCTGTRTTAIMCQLASKRLRFFGCKTNDSCHSKAMLSMLDLFACEVLNIDSDIKGLQEV